MFQSARIRLTLWYLLIIVCVSVLFSIPLFHASNQEFQRLFRRVQMSQDRNRIMFPRPEFPFPPLNENDLIEAQQRVIFRLILINVGVIVLAGMASYFLAGKTLEPIQNMVKQQERFIADAAHELRTPLTALQTEMEAQLLEKSTSSSSAKKLIQSNLEEVLDLQKLSNHLLQLSQPKSLIKLDQQSSVREAINQAQAKLSSIIKRKQIRVQIKGSDSKVQMDQISLNQLLLILVDNAVKYSPDNGKVTVNVSMHQNKVSIEVKDEGEGISPTDLPHVFERFYRADSSRSKKSVDGFGLGLSIAKNIVEQHGGTISVLSTLSKGSTFCVQLPGTV